MDLHETNPTASDRWGLAVCATASIGGLLFGFDTAVVSGTIDSVGRQFNLTDWQVGWFGSSALVGCIVGAISAGWASDRFGRKPVLVVSAVLFLLSALFCAIPPGFNLLIAARIVGGVGIGLASVVAPMYISEFAPTHARGRYVAFYQLSIVVGILLAFCSNYAIERYCLANRNVGATGWHLTLIEESWRAMFGMGMVPAVVFLAALFAVPESPRWLELRRNARRGEGSPLSPEASGSIRELLAPGLRVALLVGVSLAFFGQMSGVNIVVYYGPSVLEAAGIAKEGALLFQVGFGVINLAGTIAALFIIDRMGRRPLLLGGMAVAGAMLAVVAALFHYGGQEAMKSVDGNAALALRPEYGKWIVVALSVYMAAIAIGICSVIWVLTPELFPTRVRGRAAAIATFVNWSTNAISVWWFPPFVAAMGVESAFLAFAASCLVATLFFYAIVPETRGKSLEQIELEWIDAPPPLMNPMNSLAAAER